MSPAYQSIDKYDDIDDYSPVVSDIEDQNDDDTDPKVKLKRKDDLDNNDILQKILNEQSASKCELEEGNVSDQGEHDDADEIKESTFETIHSGSNSQNMDYATSRLILFQKKERSQTN